MTKITLLNVLYSIILKICGGEVSLFVYFDSLRPINNLSAK